MAVYTQAVLAPDPLYLQPKSYDARSDRKWFSDLLSAGVVGAGDYAVTATTSNMNISVAAGTAYILGQNIPDQGTYRQYSAVATVLTTPSNASGNPRVDTVILRVMDTAADSSSFSECRVEIVPGTPTAGATLTNLNGTANLTILGEASKSVLVLAYLLVPTGATSLTTAANIKDVRTRAGIGGNIPGGIPVGATLEWNSSTPPAGGFYLTEDGSAVSRSLYAALFSAIGTQHGAGDGSTTMNIPDSRGRSPFGYAPSGGHAEMATVGANDGLAVGVRRSRHKHSLGASANVVDPTHGHGAGTGALDGGGFGTWQNGSSVGGAGGRVTQPSATGISVGLTVTVGPQTGSEPTDTPGYIVKHKLIRAA